ncbi:MAG: carbohydrate ABC transporter permease [Rhizobiales bacterium]|jgi:multiple sugar transport system permease protein|nr:carbohydrate ABC transporter permease [Hyphomicrobiales bacterium]MBN9010644.1 carbohydrate ABC transporter permease [Hyphomicrobiales bacterium]
MARRPDQGRGSAILRHAVLALATLVFCIPFIWMLLTSFKSRPDIFNGGIDPWPRQWGIVENYSRILFDVPMPRYLLNGAIVCLGIMALQILVAAPVAYALAKLKFRAARWLLPLIVVALAIPAFLPTLPLYLAFRLTGLISSSSGAFGNYAALILPFSISAFGVFLLRQHFKSVPDELVHAARLDGMSDWSIVWRVMVPHARPAIVAFCIFSVVAHWNDLFWPLIVISDNTYATPPIGIIAFVNESVGGGDYGPLMAAATAVTLPIIAVYLLGQRFMADGMALMGK